MPPVGQASPGIAQCREHIYDSSGIIECRSVRTYLVYAVQAALVVSRIGANNGSPTLAFFGRLDFFLCDAKSFTVLKMQSHLMIYMSHNFGGL